MFHVLNVEFRDSRKLGGYLLGYHLEPSNRDRNCFVDTTIEFQGRILTELTGQRDVELKETCIIARVIARWLSDSRTLSSRVVWDVKVEREILTVLIYIFTTFYRLVRFVVKVNVQLVRLPCIDFEN